MKKFFAMILGVLVCCCTCFANTGGNLKHVQAYVEGSSVWEQETLDEFQKILETKFPKNMFRITLDPEFAAAVEVYRDDEPFFTNAEVKTLAVRTNDWIKITKNNPCDYVMYCKIIRGDAKKKKNIVPFSGSTTRVEMDCTLRLFNVAKGEYTYATKYRTIGKSHNTSNFERAERKAVTEAFETMKLDLNKI